MAGFVKRWAKRAVIGAAVGAAALYFGYKAADKHLTDKYEHVEERNATEQGIEKIVLGAAHATEKLSSQYADFLTKQGYHTRMEHIAVDSYKILFIEENGDERTAYYRVTYTDKTTGEQHSNIGTFILGKEGSEWKIQGE